MRSRNIKPGFFLNEELAACQPLARLLFSGLWCLADREGRLEDRPRRIKAELLPYDDCDIEDLLSQLHHSGFIIRYQSQGSKYIQVTGFCKHQNPHVREPSSTIPAPDEHSASTVLELDLHEPSTSLARLIPDSGFLIPEEKHYVESQAFDPVDNSALPKINGCPYQAVVELYHEVLVPPLPRVFQLTPARKQHMAARWRDELPDLADWRAYFESVRNSKLVAGFRRPDGTYWKPNIDWLIRQGNLTKVAEGNYG